MCSRPPHSSPPGDSPQRLKLNCCRIWTLCGTPFCSAGRYFRLRTTRNASISISRIPDERSTSASRTLPSAATVHRHSTDTSMLRAPTLRGKRRGDELRSWAGLDWTGRGVGGGSGALHTEQGWEGCLPSMKLLRSVFWQYGPGRRPDIWQILTRTRAGSGAGRTTGGATGSTPVWPPDPLPWPPSGAATGEDRSGPGVPAPGPERWPGGAASAPELSTSGPAPPGLTRAATLDRGPEAGTEVLPCRGAFAAVSGSPARGEETGRLPADSGSEGTGCDARSSAAAAEVKVTGISTTGGDVSPRLDGQRDIAAMPAA